MKIAHNVSERIISKQIYWIRNKKVMLDSDLAKLYGVGTRDLNKAVSRNINRFPDGFMFQLTKEEFRNLMFRFGTSSWGGTRKMPKVFTEQGVAMLSSVLNSERAIYVNIQIMRTFTKLREFLATHENLRRKIEALERKFTGKFKKQDRQFQAVFDAIRQLMAEPSKPKRKIGFHP